MISNIFHYVSYPVKEKHGFSLFGLIVAMALIAIAAAFAVPRFYDLGETASKELLKATVFELNGREKLAWVEVQNSQNGWLEDEIVFVLVDTDLGTDFHWAPKAKKNGGTLHFKDQKLKLERIPSTSTSAGKWEIKSSPGNGNQKDKNKDKDKK